MKKSLILCAAVLLLATGCSSKDKNGNVKPADTSSVVTDHDSFDDDFEEEVKENNKKDPTTEKAEKENAKGSDKASDNTSDKTEENKNNSSSGGNSENAIGNKLDSFDEVELKENEMDESAKEELRKASTGKFVITLYADKAPITCANFEKLVSEGFYDGFDFYRVVNGLMAFTGEPEKSGLNKHADTIKGEFSENGVENDLCFDRGVVGMIREDDPNSASSGFFICYSDMCVFDGYYAGFGKITEGMETVDAFTTVQMKEETGEDKVPSVPAEPIKIKSAKMISNDKDGNHRVEFEMENFIK